MDYTITGVITHVQGPSAVIDRKTGQPNGATETVFRVEESGAEYPDSVILRIYEKDGSKTKLMNTFKQLPGFVDSIAVGMFGTFHFHLRGSMGISQAGRPYAINDTFICWKAEDAARAQNSVVAQQPMAAPQVSQPIQQVQQVQAQPMNPFQQQFSPNIPQQQPAFQGGGWQPMR